jgi:predicted RNase H-like HicB family nuclease
MTATLRLHSEDIDGRVLLFPLDLAGCWAEGATEAEALANLPAALAAYHAWLAVHGETGPDPPGEPRVVERVRSRLLRDGYEVNALFAPERRPPDRALLVRGRRLLVHAGADLLAALGAIPEHRRNVAPAGTRTPRQIVEHVARAELWYLRHFVGAPTTLVADHPPGSEEQFSAVHAALLDWLATASPEQLGQLTVEREEEWSVRKLLRRALWHARTHTADLARRKLRHASLSSVRRDS